MEELGFVLVKSALVRAVIGVIEFAALDALQPGVGCRRSRETHLERHQSGLLAFPHIDGLGEAHIVAGIDLDAASEVERHRLEERSHRHSDACRRLGFRAEDIGGHGVSPRLTGPQLTLRDREHRLVEDCGLAVTVLGDEDAVVAELPDSGGQVAIGRLVLYLELQILFPDEGEGVGVREGYREFTAGVEGEGIGIRIGGQVSRARP